MSQEKLKRVFEISEGLDDLDDEPLEEVLRDLQESGLDPVPLIRFAQEKLAELRGPTRLAEAKAKREKMEHLRERTKSVYKQHTPTMRADILALVANMAPELSPVFHRKFQETKDEDLLSLLEDLEFLDVADKEPDGSA